MIKHPPKKTNTNKQKNPGFWFYPTPLLFFMKTIQKVMGGSINDIDIILLNLVRKYKIFVRLSWTIGFIQKPCGRTKKITRFSQA